MAAKRKFYKAQTVRVGEWLREHSFGDFNIIGPRENDGRVLLIRRTPTLTLPYIMEPDGELEAVVGVGVDPRDFGYRGPLTNG